MLYLTAGTDKMFINEIPASLEEGQRLLSSEHYQNVQMTTPGFMIIMGSSKAKVTASRQGCYHAEISANNIKDYNRLECMVYQRLGLEVLNYHLVVLQEALRLNNKNNFVTRLKWLLFGKFE